MIDIYWHPRNMGVRYQRTSYAHYISIWHLIVNIRSHKK